MLDVFSVIHGANARVLRVQADGQLRPGDLSPADLTRPVAGVSVDSRLVSPGGLFVALRGERVDGHDYVGQALRSGALGCVVTRPPTPETLRGWREGAEMKQTWGTDAAEQRYCFVVRDSLTALQQLATYWRSQQRAEVIGITGSVGKTTAKEIIASVLSPSRSVLKSEANLNTEIGLPLMLLRLEPRHEVAVLEMGMHAAGDISLLADIARPRIGVVTNVAPVHLERMGTIERIAREKSRLVAALPRNGLAVLNGDDLWTRAMAQTSGIAPVILAGRGPECEYRAVELRTQGLDGFSFTLQTAERTIALQTQVPGTHTVFAFLAAAAIAREVGMGWEEIQASISQVRIDARQRLLSGPEGLLIIDDSYNASPLSMKAALDLLQASRGTKIAVLGDMLELGPGEEAAHREIGAQAARVADWLVVRGPRSSWMAEAATGNGLPPSHVVRAESNVDAALAVRMIVSEPGDASAGQEPPTMQQAKAALQPEAAPPRWSVLVKGSRGMRMEEVVQALRGEV